MSTGDFTLDHPVLASLVVAACSAAGVLVAVGALSLLLMLRLISPGNVVAGVFFGLGGAVAGLFAAFPVLGLIQRRRS